MNKLARLTTLSGLILISFILIFLSNLTLSQPDLGDELNETIKFVNLTLLQRINPSVDKTDNSFFDYLGVKYPFYYNGNYLTFDEGINYSKTADGIKIETFDGITCTAKWDLTPLDISSTTTEKFTLLTINDKPNLKYPNISDSDIYYLKEINKSKIECEIDGKTCHNISYIRYERVYLDNNDYTLTRYGVFTLINLNLLSESSEFYFEYTHYNASKDYPLNISDVNAGYKLNFNRGILSEPECSGGTLNNIEGYLYSVGRYILDLDPSFYDSTSASFSLGTHQNTTNNNTDVYLEANVSGQYNFTGVYTSQIFDSGNSVSFDNITWNTTHGWINNSLAELPNNQAVEIGYGGINMTGNVLLLHLNNNSYLSENDTFVNDSSGNNINGTVYGAKWIDSGKLKGAFEFDGKDNYINIPENQKLRLNETNTLSVSLWAKVNDTTNDEYMIVKGLVSLGQGHYDGYIIKSNTTGVTVIINGNITGTHHSSSGGEMNDKEWHNIFAVLNIGGSVKVYLDGGLIVNENDTNHNVYTGDNDFRIGTWLEQSLYFNGTMDEIAIWNRTLSEAEIKDIYQRGVNRLNLQTRTSNDNSVWTAWSNNNTNPSLNINVSTKSLQYRAIMTTENINFTPILHWVNISYTINNYSPDITPPIANISIRANYTLDLTNYEYDQDSTSLNWSYWINDTTYANIDVIDNLTNKLNLSIIADGNSYMELTLWDDIVGYLNDTQKYINILVDTIIPDINFTSPTLTNDTTQYTNSIYINVSTNDTNEHSAFIDFNNSLVGWYNFENGTNGIMIDNSSYGNDGSVVGSVPSFHGKRGKAALFDGNSANYLKVVKPIDEMNFDADKNFTVSVWFNARPSSNNVENLVGKMNNDGWRIDVSKTGQIRALLYGDSNNNVGTYYSVNARDEKWHHAVFTFARNSTLTVYFDGIQKGTTAINAGNASEDIDFHIGRGIAGGSTFNGTIDEVMIWSRVLTPEEINATYQAGTYRLYNNFSVDFNQTYKYKAWTIDEAGNINTTGYFTVNTSSPTGGANTYSRNATQGINLNNIQLSGGNIKRSNINSIGLSDILDKLTSIKKYLTNDINIQDKITRFLNILKYPLQLININDIADKFKGLTNYIIDSINIQDKITKLREALRLLVDKINIQDKITKFLSFFRNLLDLLGISFNLENLPKEVIEAIEGASTGGFGSGEKLSSSDILNFTDINITADNTWYKNESEIVWLLIYRDNKVLTKADIEITFGEYTNYFNINNITELTTGIYYANITPSVELIDNFYSMDVNASRYFYGNNYSILKSKEIRIKDRSYIETIFDKEETDYDFVVKIVIRIIEVIGVITLITSIVYYSIKKKETIKRILRRK